MDQRQSELHHSERFRAGSHAADVKHENPPLRPHGIVDDHELPQAPPRPAPSMPADLPSDDSRLDSQSLIEADQASIDVAKQLDDAGPAPEESNGAN